MRQTFLCVVICAACSTLSPATEVAVRDSQFLINGKPTFLLGISYYAGLGAPRDLAVRDLDEMRRRGFNWVRVWATWAAFGNDVSAVDARGNPRNTFFDHLRWLLRECDQRGMIVDVTLARGKGPGHLNDFESHKRAVEALITAFQPSRNWYLDLANERNIRDQRFVSFEELADLRKLVRSLDPKRLVTASHAGADLTRDDLRRYLLDVRVDFVTPHRPRDATSPKQTFAQTKKCLEWMRSLGRITPVHYQEPFRRGYAPRQWDPRTEDFLADLKGAREGGAAGWCFHNGGQQDSADGRPRRSFDLRELRLFPQLDADERAFLQELLERAEEVGKKQ